jgi:hypothetical protein
MRDCIIIPQITRGIVTQMVDKFPKEMQGRDGGHIVIQEVGKDIPVHSCRVRVGKHEVSDEDYQRYEKNALEKASRLSRFAHADNHVSSWQSRDPDNGQYGGAVVATGMVISFSGLPEFLDEHLVIQVGLYFHRIGGSVIKEILTISGSPHR